MDFNQIWHKATVIVPLSINALLVTLYFNGVVSLDTPLPLNRDGKGLGTQAVKTCTFMPRNRRPNQIARATCSFVLSHDLTWCQREEKGLLTQNCRRRHFRGSSRTCSSTSLVEEPAVGGLDTSRSERSARKQSLHSSGGKEDFVTLPTSYLAKLFHLFCSPLFYMMCI